MTVTVPRKPVIHSPEEKAQVIAEGIRLERAGQFGAFVDGFQKAQKVLPEHRRRLSVQSTNAMQWFVGAIKAFRNSPKPPQGVDNEAAQATLAGSHSNASQGDLDDGDGKLTRVRWSPKEQHALCAEAARLITDMLAGGPREALMIAQENVLPPHRRRTRISPASIANWYPEGRQAAIAKLRSERSQSAAAVAELAKINREIADQTSQPPTPIGQHFAVEPGSQPPAPAVPVPAPAPAAPAPAPEQEPPAIPTAPETPPQITAAAEPTTVVIPGSTDDLVGHLVGLWKGIRERLVQEVSNVFVEGIHRGMQRITLIKPETAEVAETAKVAATHEPDPPRAATPAAPSPAPTNSKAKPSQSVLVVGLKGDQPEHIRAAFADKLDLRFCSVDQSKDTLRTMASVADVVVGVTDFISHSHEDIIRNRSRHYIRSSGGITRLKQELSRLTGAPYMNGQTHA